MSDEDNFDNYLSDYISTSELKAFLDFVSKKPAGEPLLIFSVNDSDDEMVKGEASTWMQVSTSRSDMLCYMLKDDDGKSELNRFEMTLSGLADCLDALSSQQDEVNFDDFYASVM